MKRTTGLYWGSEEGKDTQSEDTDNSSGKSGSVVEESEGNQIYFYSVINRENILRLNQSLLEKANELISFSSRYGIAPIPIYIHINSHGGSFFDCMAAYDTIRSLKVPTCSIVEGGAASAATIISMACEKRYIRPTSMMLIHQLRTLHMGKYEELKDDMQNTEKMMDIIYTIYGRHTTVPKEKIDEILKHDLWFDAEECLKYNMVDEILY